MNTNKNEWVSATMADLTKGTVFRFPEDSDDRASVVTAGAAHYGTQDGSEWLWIFSRNVSTDKPEGKSILRAESPVLVRKTGN